jgi:hypothetical protein
MSDTNTIAQIIVLLFGIAMCVLSVWAMFVPERLRQLVNAITYQAWGYYIAGVVRIMLGLALVLAAPGSRFPVVFQLVGWLTIAAAVGLLIIGQDRLKILAESFDRLSNTVYRAWLIIAVAFGLSLVYGVS